MTFTMFRRHNNLLFFLRRKMSLLGQRVTQCDAASGRSRGKSGRLPSALEPPPLIQSIVSWPTIVAAGRVINTVTKLLTFVPDTVTC